MFFFDLLTQSKYLIHVLSTTVVKYPYNYCIRIWYIVIANSLIIVKYPKNYCNSSLTCGYCQLPIFTQLTACIVMLHSHTCVTGSSFRTNGTKLAYHINSICLRPTFRNNPNHFALVSSYHHNLIME